jgi:hypothetical protein
VAFAAAVLACTAEPRPGTVALRVVTGIPSGGGDALVVARGGDTLVVRSAELVLREIQLQRVRVGECEEEEGERCAMVAAGPTRFVLPLAHDSLTFAPVAAVADTYGTVQLEVYRPMPARDSAWLASYPDLAGSSLRVTGTYSRAGARRDFAFESDMNEVLELTPDAPLVVANGRVSPLLLEVAVATWFVSADGGALIDPATAGPGGPNAAQVRDNVRTSFSVRVPSSP